MKRAITRAGVIRASIFFAVLIVIPLAGGPVWLLNLLIFTVMYAAMASSWNILGGYAGYPSLGHVAFFGIGAYTVGILFSNSVGNGYLPFLVLIEIHPMGRLNSATATPITGRTTNGR